MTFSVTLKLKHLFNYDNMGLSLSYLQIENTLMNIIKALYLIQITYYLC